MEFRMSADQALTSRERQIAFVELVTGFLLVLIGQDGRKLVKEESR
jgi:hypothetical protein